MVRYSAVGASSPAKQRMQGLMVTGRMRQQLLLKPPAWLLHMEHQHQQHQGGLAARVAAQAVWAVLPAAGARALGAMCAAPAATRLVAPQLVQQVELVLGLFNQTLAQLQLLQQRRALAWGLWARRV